MLQIWFRITFQIIIDQNIYFLCIPTIRQTAPANMQHASAKECMTGCDHSMKRWIFTYKISLDYTSNVSIKAAFHAENRTYQKRRCEARVLVLWSVHLPVDLVLTSSPWWRTCCELCPCLEDAWLSWIGPCRKNIHYFNQKYRQTILESILTFGISHNLQTMTGAMIWRQQEHQHSQVHYRYKSWRERERISFCLA